MWLKALSEGSNVLITGATGYVGSAVVEKVLAAGYRVRAVVRTRDKAELLDRIFSPRYKDSFETCVIPDQAKNGALREAVRDCQGLIATASNVTFNKDPNAVIPSAIDLVQEALRAAAESSTVSRFVFCSSSNALVRDRTLPRTITQDSWNEAAITLAYAADDDPQKARDVYAASKVLAERACWHFVRTQKPSFTLNTVIPNFTIGRSLHPELQSSSYRYIRGMFENRPEDVQRMRIFGSHNATNIEDAAIVHVGALEMADIQSERILAMGHPPFHFNSLVDVMRKIDPDRDLPEKLAHSPVSQATFENEIALEILSRYGRPGFISLEQMIRDNVGPD